jgi:catechol 2,3-dioxygenase-like lactoylglutathione lyase family enzyme
LTDESNTRLSMGIVTDDGDTLVAFYRDGLGFELEDDRTFPLGQVRRFVHGSARLKIFEPAGDTAPGPVGQTWWEHRGMAYGALEVSDAGRVVADALAAGASLLAPVTEHRPGARAAIIADPQGNVWEILEERRTPDS